jgi:hypothetical protein
VGFANPICADVSTHFREWFECRKQFAGLFLALRDCQAASPRIAPDATENLPYLPIDNRIHKKLMSCCNPAGSLLRSWIEFTRRREGNSPSCFLSFAVIHFGEVKMSDNRIVERGKLPVDRRAFIRNAGGAAVATAAALAAGTGTLHASTTVADTPQEIFTAALVAEDLATTFYYNMLTGSVIQSGDLAGRGGTAVAPSSSGQADNVDYIRAAIYQEIQHANLFRSLLGLSNSAADPYQTFYFNPALFSDFTSCLSYLVLFENIFIGAYLAATVEFGLLAAQGQTLTFSGQQFAPTDLAFYAQVAASILGIESQHLALGRSLNPNIIPANNINYQQQGSVLTVYNGSHSAVAALTPYLAPASGTSAYSLQTALTGAPSVWLQTGGNIPLGPTRY